ncbi:MAG TPA: serine/threonine-protein kinase [Polyangiaceae bacterium]
MSSSPGSDGGPSPSSTSQQTYKEPSNASFERPVLRVGRYRILSELGRGGMSNVYLAVAHGPGGVNKLVVLKALLPDFSSEQYALAMFLDEARLAAQLNHPNVVQTYEVGTEGDRHVIVMEYLEGQSLSAVLKRGEQQGDPLSPALHIKIVIAALEGLHYAHELRAYDGAPLQLVHRDISPQNVFVTYDGQVKVLDFGIAKAASSSTHTATGIVKGKIAYMAPEQTIGDTVDRRADIYSIGCMLWAAAVGRKLWKDTPDVHIMRRVINGDVPTPQSANPSCDDELNRIVMKALATDPRDRYQTALEIQQDLEAYLEMFGDQIKQKDIARYVSALFADRRAEIQALVERQLALAVTDESSRSRSIVSSDGRTTSTGTRPSFVPTIVAEPSPEKGSTGLKVVLALGAVLLAVGGFYFLRSRAEAEAPKPVVAQPVPQAAPTATTATVEFRATPPEAKLFLDGQPLPSNPTSRVLEIDGAIHRLKAEADGFATATAEFKATRDTVLELSLNALTESPSPVEAPSSSASSKKPSGGRNWKRPPEPPVAPPPTPTPTPTPATGKPASCAAPFFVDKDGIKRIRPECL